MYPAGNYLYMPTDPIKNTCQYYCNQKLDIHGKPTLSTGTTEPDWPTTLGATVVDNDVTWINAGQSGVFQGFGPLDHYKRLAPPTGGSPTSEYYRQGAIVWNTDPLPGGNVGWVCTAAGKSGIRPQQPA